MYVFELRTLDEIIKVSKAPAVFIRASLELQELRDKMIADIGIRPLEFNSYSIEVEDRGLVMYSYGKWCRWEYTTIAKIDLATESCVTLEKYIEQQEELIASYLQPFKEN